MDVISSFFIIAEGSADWEQPVAYAVLAFVAVGISWLAKLIVPSWIKSIVTRNEEIFKSAKVRDQKIAEDNETAHKERADDMLRWGEERKDLVLAIEKLALLPQILITQNEARAKDNEKTHEMIEKILDRIDK